MKKNFLAMVAVALLAGPMAAQAGFIYSFESPDDGFAYRTADFKFVAPTLLTVTTTLTAADLFDVNSYYSLNLLSVSLFDPGSTSPGISMFFADGSGVANGSWSGPFDHIGTYVHASGDRLTISTFDDVTVPEPATLALFSLGLAGLGFARRRRTTN